MADQEYTTTNTMYSFKVMKHIPMDWNRTVMIYYEENYYGCFERNFFNFSKKSNTKFPYCLEILIISIYTKELKTWVIQKLVYT